MPLAKVAERFTAKLNDLEEMGASTPIMLDGSLSFLYVQYSNLYLLAVTQANVNAAATLVFLHKLIEIFKHYFHEVGTPRGVAALSAASPLPTSLGGARHGHPPVPPPPLHLPESPARPVPSLRCPALSQLEEESLRDNFVIAYELLDEVMDFGYPQFTEAKILAEFIKTDAHRLAVQARPPMAVTNAVSWRQEGLFYKKNEVFLDVVESVNLLVNSNGTVVRSEVVGALKMRAYLSGMVSERACVGAGPGGHTV